jgi:hypothetical protein
MIIDDEDIAYGRQQQRKLDEKDRPAPQFARDYGVQQYAHHDPAPRLPFDNAWEPPRSSRGEKVIWGVVLVACVVAVAAVEVLS